jgi:site-specific DNA recombinase
VDRDVFEAAQQILIARGDDHAGCAANASDYLLARLIRCARCGKRYVGGVANGRSRRYRYYTCFSRGRYGKNTCPSERLPADTLDAAVLDSLLATYQEAGLFEQALAGLADRDQRQRERREQELAAATAELSKAEEAIDRYLTAFEAGALTDAQCAHRIRALSAKAGELRGRRDELTTALDESSTPKVTPAELHQMRDRIAEAVTTGETKAQKTSCRGSSPTSPSTAATTSAPRSASPPAGRSPPDSRRFASWTDRWA